MKKILCRQFVRSWNLPAVPAQLLICLALASQGCGPGNQATPPSAQTSGGDQKIVIKGSNTIGEELAPRLIAEWKKDHPSSTVELETKGSASGFWGLIAGVCDIAAASRGPIQDEAQQAKVRGIELKDNLIGFYSVAVIVSSNSPVPSLSKTQVHDIFSGKITNWKEVGGPDGAIHVYGRDPISGTYLGFRELAMQDSPYIESLKTFTNYTAIAQAVAHDTHAIGYVSLNHARDPGVKALAIEGIDPTTAAVTGGKYPYARPLHLYTQAEGSPAAKEFIQFVQSKRGQEIVAQTGNVPRP